MIKALDISKHQGGFDPQKAKAEGVELVLLRAGYGTDRDRLFKSFAAACQKADLRTGAYLFLTCHYRQQNGGDEQLAHRLMEKQVDALLETLKGSGVSSWVALDQELEQNAAMGLGREANTRLLNAAAARVRAAGYAPCLYCSAAWLAQRVQAPLLKMPVWGAYYYKSPEDPDFGGCLPLKAVSTRWGRYLLGLGAQLCGWQFGSAGYGEKYGVQSQNLDKSWFYYQPEDLAEKTEIAMGFVPAEPGQRLRVTRAEKPCCEAFPLPSIHSGGEALPMGESYAIQKEGPTQWAGGMEGRWLKLDRPQNPYLLALPDRCDIEPPAPIPPTPPEQPDEPPIRILGKGTPRQLGEALARFLEAGGLAEEGKTT